MMDTEHIIKLLSNHRQPHDSNHPQALTARAISNLIDNSLRPESTITTDQVRLYLGELQAQGEILAGLGNRFCMAPPCVLAESETNLVGVLFRGDRAYLQLAHQALETNQPITETQLRPQISGFYRIKQRLKNYGIRLLTVTDSIDHLPQPERPNLRLLAGMEWDENPFQVLGQIMQYVPQEWQNQRERWQLLERIEQRTSQLLRLSTGEYVWFESEQFYELSPDAASLAMFWLDHQAELPLRVHWDDAPGRLNLQGIILPSSYAQLLWRLSEADSDQPRTRLFRQSSQRLIVRETLNRLGCLLV